METVVLPDATVIEYELIYKKVKNMTLRIRPDGTVTVTVNRRVSQNRAEEFVREHAAWLQKRRQLADTRRQIGLPERLEQDTQVLWLGTEYRVAWSHPAAPAVELYGDLAVVSMPDPSAEFAAKVYRDWYQAQSERVLTDALDRVFPHFEPLGLCRPRLCLRYMTSRWGSCSYHKGKITLNRYLCQLPPALIDVVTAHELAHFFHPDHSPAFYRLLEQVFPGYRETAAQLKEYFIL